MKNILESIYKFFISLKLAIFTLSLLAFSTAIGTFIESKYNQEIANKLIYHSWVMVIILLLLSINLFFVLIDRWPWKKRQVGFVFAHIGILMMILGSVITRYVGVDAVLSFKEGEKVSFMRLPEKEIKIYSSYDGSKFTLLHQEDVDFFFQRPSQKQPHIISVSNEIFTIDQYIPYGSPRENYKKTLKVGEPAVRFYLEGRMGQFVDWIQMEKGKETITESIGPAFITLTKNKNYQSQRKKEMILFVEGNKLFYSLSHPLKKRIKVGDVFQTQWMDFKFRLIEFFPRSKKEFIFYPQKNPTENTLQALKVHYKDSFSWVGENAYVRFFTKNRVYAFGYLNKTKSLGFDLKLIDFRMTKYQGSEKAKSYESEVEVLGETKIISMNEPLKYRGYTFYQSSFEENEKGEAKTSILSVNRDPGRIVKYIGSFFIVAGIALLFLKRRLFGLKRKITV